MARERVVLFGSGDAYHVYTRLRRGDCCRLSAERVEIERVEIERVETERTPESLGRREEDRGVMRVKRKGVVAVVRELGRRKETLESRDVAHYGSPTTA